MGRMPANTLWITFVAVVFVVAATGCTSSLIHWNKTEPESKLVDETSESKMVRDMTRVWGLRPTTIQGIGMVSQLANTGSDPPASPHRDMLLDDMRRRQVERPGSILGLPSTALVLVRANLPAGVQKGDRIDIEVRTPPQSESESLRGGWLMSTRLQEMAVLGNRLRQGNLLGQAEGSVLVNSLFESDSDARFETVGRVLGGGISNVDRSLKLVLTTEHHSVRASAMIGNAINARFHTYDRGTKRGVATPKRDTFIDLAIHRRYRRNLLRYVRVVQAVALRESPRDRLRRMEELEDILMDPATAVSAAVDLEAIGAEALPTLRRGLASDKALVRFAAAEALAYMNEAEAVPHLVESARNRPALRWHSLTALSVMSETEARDGLVELMHEASDETRYGAFKSLIDFNPRDPAAHGEVLGDVMALHQIPTETEPLIHVRLTNRPEVVLFGSIKLHTPAVLFAGPRILIKSDESDRIKVSYFSMGQDDRVEYCRNDLGALIHAIVAVGGSYTDVVAAINNAKQKGSVSARVKFDAIPKPGREYQLDRPQEADDFVPDAEDLPIADDPDDDNESSLELDFAASDR